MKQETDKLKQTNELFDSDFENGVAIALGRQGLVAITKKGIIFPAKFAEIVREVYKKPEFILQILDILKTSKQLTDACYEAIKVALKNSRLSKKDVNEFLLMLNETLELVGLPKIKPDERKLENILLPEKEPQF